MSGPRRDVVNRLVIASTLVSLLLILVFGWTRVKSWVTPRLERVWIVSADLEDVMPAVAPRFVETGTPVRLYAIVEATPWRGDGTRFYGPVDSMVLESGGDPVPVEAWSDWWQPLEILWFKVEPVFPFGNTEFDPDLDLDDVPYQDVFMHTWGFGSSHALDIQPTGDAYPRWEVGTMRFTARAAVRDYRDRVLDQASAPAAESVSAQDPREAPHRVTVEGGDDALGVLQGFAGLPYFPTRADAPEHPAPRYLGGTILDFWMLSYGAGPSGLVDWRDLGDVADVVVADMFLANDDVYYYSDDPLTPVTFDEVRPGDLITIDDHVGVLYQDRGPGGGGDGLLNRWDQILGGYFEPLRVTQMGDAFQADITILRLRAVENPVER